MIPARKGGLIGPLFRGHARRRIRRSFEVIRIHGLDEARAAVAAGPVLVVSNHTSWWDPLVAITVSELLAADPYAMMDAKNLRALPFFGRVGAFGVDLDDPADGARAIRYAAKLLRAPRVLVWIFAQGRERPITARPLGFRGGSAEVARVARRARVLPVALRYEMGGTERPAMWIAIGAPVAVADRVDETRSTQERAVEVELDRIDAALLRGEAGSFAPVLVARASPLSALLQRTLAWLSRARLPR